MEKRRGLLKRRPADQQGGEVARLEERLRQLDNVPRRMEEIGHKVGDEVSKITEYRKEAEGRIAWNRENPDAKNQ